MRHMFLEDLFGEVAGFREYPAHHGCKRLGWSRQHFKDGAQHRVQKLIERDRSAAGFGFASIQHCEAALVDGIQSAGNHGVHQSFLGLEMIVDGRQIHACFRGNGPERGGFDSLMCEKTLGGIEDARLSVHTAV